MTYAICHLKIIFILSFNGANCITSNLEVTLKGKNLLPKGANSLRVAPNEEPIGLRLPHEKVHTCISPIEQNKQIF